MAKLKKFDLSAFRAVPLPTEQEIMATWQGNMDRPVVSVLCITYNHKPYIEDAFKGFLIQKTDFPFEVIVHDDASTDGTTAIVREYASKYPDIIKPVIQVENQYSQGKRPTLLSYPFSKGEYIALCEGDDFWISSDKLQKQVEVLQKNSNINLVFHPAYELNMMDDRLTIIGDYQKKNGPISTFYMVRESKGRVATSSLFFRRLVLDVFKEMHSQLANTANGDIIIRVIGSSNSGAYFLHDLESLYRFQSMGSWSSMNNKEMSLDYIALRIHSFFWLKSKYSASLSEDVDWVNSRLTRGVMLNFSKEREERIAFLKKVGPYLPVMIVFFFNLLVSKIWLWRAVENMKNTYNEMCRSWRFQK